MLSGFVRNFIPSFKIFNLISSLQLKKIKLVLQIGHKKYFLGCEFCFPFPLRTKEETAALKTRKNVWEKGLIAFSRHNNCEPVCAMLINTKRNHSIAK
ncbi:hypothetical protein BEN42_03810 [Leptospira interrogans serovar Canicola]|nr:hypothetical protein AWU66_10840 [Leptospira interrogans serovar Pomona]MCR8626421.1 hypothetical protein [Leptospira interrogans serovar Canicola]OQM32551.1 hypothetical protein DV30_04585 [Leptospira interrogans serovar Canicola str. Gui44]OQN92961.1 hypothetical protein AR690_11160 [Leptospira interrogans serovar Lai]